MNFRIHPVLLALGVALLPFWACQACAAEIDVASLATSELEGFEKQPEAIRTLIRDALKLTELKLGYQYGSHDPSNGGMDCSGTIYHLLRRHKIDRVPRQANLIYRWLWREGQFNAVVSDSESSFELERLKPGDLLFWTGTYEVDRDPPVTHVMLYLGRKKSDGKPVMFGASSGRRYEGKARHGVSVFDFRIPKHNGNADDVVRSRFIGYGAVPGINPARSPKSPLGKK